MRWPFRAPEPPSDVKQRLWSAWAARSWKRWIVLAIGIAMMVIGMADCEGGSEPVGRLRTALTLVGVVVAFGALKWQDGD